MITKQNTLTPQYTGKHTLKIRDGGHDPNVWPLKGKTEGGTYT